MSASSQRFLDAVGLRPVDARVFDAAFEAVPQQVPWPKAYGGDMVAQALAAAIATIGEDRRVHSMHSYFLRPVDMHVPVRYEVERLRDGRGYSTRTVRGFQHDKPVYVSMLSFAVGAPSGQYAVSMPEVPAPQDLPSAAEVLDGVAGDAAGYWSTGRSFDMRHVPGPLYIAHDGERIAHQAVWVRAFENIGDEPVLAQVALAYVCDYTILEPSLRALGLHWSSPGLVTASLDHSMWFHRPANPNDWLLYAQEAVAVTDGRGLNTGRFFDSAGTLIATVAQEGMIADPAAGTN